jgi:FkbM family methyltransferase
MRNSLKRAFEFCSLQCKLRNPGVASQLFAAHGAPENFQRANGGILMRDTGLAVNRHNAMLLGRAAAEMRTLTSTLGVQWKPSAAARFEARVRDLSFEISSAEDVFVLLEVFGIGVYAFAQPSEAIVIDIGANIGASALFFASKPSVKHVYAFEPLKPTAKVAKSNFDRNPSVGSKITLAEFGLSSTDEMLNVEYSPEWKGKSGPSTLPSDLPRTIQSWREDIELKKASAVLRPILDSVGAATVFMKMDCEGGEWKILPDLASAGLLKRIDHMIFEWHDKTPESLEQLLVANGFYVVRRTDALGTPLGLIYASNVERPQRGVAPSKP